MTMLIPGLGTIGNFSVWVTKTSHQDYYDCLITEHISDGFNFYINLHKDNRFPMVEFKYPPKPLKHIKDSEEVVPETEEEQIYRAEHSMYSAHKYLGQPLWYLHKNTLDKVLQKIREL